MKTILFFLLAFTCIGLRAEDAPAAPKPAMESPRQAWTRLLDRIRTLPHAGEIRNGQVSAALNDLFGDPGVPNPKLAALSTEYDKSLAALAEKWEQDCKALRMEYDAKMVGELAEARQSRARNLITLSRQKWEEASQRDAAIRNQYLEMMRAPTRQPGVPPNTPGTPGTPINPAVPTAGQAASNWMKDERGKAVLQDAETVKSLRSLLEGDEAARFDRAVRPAGPTLPNTPGAPNTQVRPNFPPAAPNFPPRPAPAPIAPNAPPALPPPPVNPAPLK